MIIGIIGGGQLGMMMAEAAKKHNHTVIGLDPKQGCSLSYVADKIIVADYNDSKAIEELVNYCDVVTYEFENVDLIAIKKFENVIPQKSKGLYYSKDRIIEKDFAKSLNIPTPRYNKFSYDNIFYPSIIKLRTGGYDGKGQWILKNCKDIDHISNISFNNCIIEELIDYDYEISVIITRDCFGNEVIYPIPKNSHRNGILFVSEVYNEIDALIVSKARKYTSKIVNELDYVGTLAVEYFVRGNEVIFNEYAPRPHNSGHYSIEGATVSQFENHILAITGKKILESNLVNPTVMINILGQDKDYIKRLNGDESHLHLYHKKESTYNRKMGHITIVTNSKEKTKKIKQNIIKE